MPGMKTEMMRKLQELQEEKLRERRGKCRCVKKPAVYNTNQVSVIYFFRVDLDVYESDDEKGDKG